MEKNWEFLSDDMKIPQPVYLDGVTNHLQLDGSIVKDKDDVMGSSPRYSRKSLMTFLFLEIYLPPLAISPLTFSAKIVNLIPL